MNLDKVVQGGLRSAIHDHGEITRDLTPSASKRVVGQLKASYGLWLIEQMNKACDQKEKVIENFDPSDYWYFAGQQVALLQVYEQLFGVLE